MSKNGNYRHIDPLALRISAGDSASELARMFLDAEPHQWAVVAGAWRQRSASLLERGVHTMRGSLGIFGARAAMEHAAAIEQACTGEFPAEFADRLVALRVELVRVTREVARFAAECPEASAS